MGMHRLQHLLSAVLIGAAVFALGGCGGQATAGREIQITAKEFAFEPDVIAVKPGERVRFVIVNTGTTDHEFESDEAKIEEITIPAGKQRTLSWTASAQPGEFAFLCDAPGHKEAGMVGKIVVQ
jgi:uncharacterized cupredoxin-like copper-binding protein